MDKEQLLQKIIELTNRRSIAHPNDYIEQKKYWNACSEMLSVDLDKTKWVLDRVGSEKLYWISEAFEDISEKLQSWEFINYLEQLQNQYPDVDMKADIQFAAEWIQTDFDEV
jgi:hypothetical protein